MIGFLMAKKFKKQGAGNHPPNPRHCATAHHTRTESVRAGVAELLSGRSQQEIDSGTQSLDHPAVAGLSLGTVETVTHESAETEGTGPESRQRGNARQHPERAMARQ